MPSAQLTAAGTDTGPGSRLLPGARAGRAGEVVRVASGTVEHGRGWSWAVQGGTVGAGLLGVVVVAFAARLAVGGTRSGVVDAVTWLGLGIAVLPAVAVVCSRHGTAGARWTALGTVALATVVPVGLRSGAGPVTPDDLLRYAQLSSLRQGAALFVDRLPSAVVDQPGLAGLTTTLWRVSGLTVWHSALVVVVVVHVVAVIGVRALVHALGFGERVAVLAAVLWALGPGVLLVTSQVDGGGLGLALSWWALAAVAQASGSTSGSASSGRRTAWSATAIGLAAATAVTDVVAAWILAALTVLLGVATLGVPAAGGLVRRSWWPSAVGVVTVTVLWSLTPPGRRVLGDLAGVAAAGHRTWTIGTGDLSVSAAVALVLALVLGGTGVHRYRARFDETGYRFALGVGALLPLSLLGLLSAPTTTFTGLVRPALAAAAAPLVAAGLLVVWDLGARRPRSAGPTPRVSASGRPVQRDTRAPVERPGGTAEAGRERRLPAPVAAVAALIVAALVLLGATATTTPTAADRTGPPLATDAVASSEILAVTDRLATLAGPGFRFAAADPRLAEVLVAVAGGVDVAGVSRTDVFDRPPDSATVAALRAARVDWLVDLAGADSDAGDALGRQPWLTRVLATSDLAVYRVRPAPPGTPSDTTGGSGADVVPAGG